MSLQSFLLVTAAAALWGLTQVLMKSGLRSMNLVCFAVLRLSIGVVVVLGIALMTSGLVFPSWKLVLIASSGGLLDSFLGTAFFMHSVRRGPSHVVTSLANAAPFWGVLGTFLFLHEPLTLSAVAAAFLVVLGAWLLARRRVGAEPTPTRVTVGALLAGVCWGLAAAVPTKYCINAGMQPSMVQLCMLSASAIGWSGVALVSRRRQEGRKWSPRGIYVAILSSITGYVVSWGLWLRALSSESAMLLSPLRGGGMTLFAFVLGMVIFRERPRLRAYLGVACLMGGIVMVSWPR